MRKTIWEAVPGAGKTHLLTDLAREKPSLLLAYNRKLADETAPRMPGDGVCLTFHALCGRCLAPARDDVQLQVAVQRAERGEIAVHDVPEVERVLVDEAQDMREVYVQLLRVLGMLNGRHEIVLAGDRHQLIYDFDEEFPAFVEGMLTPETHVMGGVWERHALNHSRRLTQPIANFVNALFGTAITSDRPGPNVEVRVPKSAFGWHAALRDVFAAEKDVLLLVDRKRKNYPLRVLLNTLSRSGSHIGANDVCTYWSAKGLEADTAIVLLPQCAPRNPTYVAMTRARRRLIVVLDPREPHAAACAASQNVEGITFHGDVRALGYGAALGDPATSFQRRDIPPRTSGSLDSFTVRHALVRTNGGVAPEAQDGGVFTEAVDGDLAARVALVCAEVQATGCVRALENAFAPVRVNFGALDDAVQAGLVARVAPKCATDDDLLAPDLRKCAVDAYRALQTGVQHEAVTVALALVAWEGFEHCMRQRIGLELDAREWASVAWACTQLSGAGVTFDVPLRRPPWHVRAHAVDPARCYHVVWGITSADECDAAVRAAMHPQRVCHILDLATQHVRPVTPAAEFLAIATAA